MLSRVRVIIAGAKQALQTKQAERLEKRIWQWFDTNYPIDQFIGSWQDENFHCYRGSPLVLRMFPVTDTLEYNICNGGWRQILWNCFGCWRTLLDVAQESYRLIEADVYAEAIDEIRVLCMREENECEELLNSEEWHFAEYTARCLDDSPNCQDVFWGFNEYEALERPDEIRSRWLLENTNKVRTALSSRVNI